MTQEGRPQHATGNANPPYPLIPPAKLSDGGGPSSLSKPGFCAGGFLTLHPFSTHREKKQGFLGTFLS